LFAYLIRCFYEWKSFGYFFDQAEDLFTHNIAGNEAKHVESGQRQDNPKAGEAEANSSVQQTNNAPVNVNVKDLYHQNGEHERYDGKKTSDYVTLHVADERFHFLFPSPRQGLTKSA
jgi:hypothetical protein